MDEEKYDFCGWATRNDLKCSDGRVIRKDAFKHNDGKTVPLVWNHDHTDPFRIIGNALLENRDEGVYAYGKFNDTELGKTAKIYVEHGDITSLSICAGNLTEQGPNVIHGLIREVSLVLAGANPGAYIENVMVHGEESEGEAIIFTGESISLCHSDSNDDKKKKESEENKEDTKEDTKENTKEENSSENGNDDSDDKEKISDIIKTLNPSQKKAVEALVGMAVEAATSEKDDKKDIEHSDNEEEVDIEHSSNEESEGGNKIMKHNVFDKEEQQNEGVLTHSDEQAIVALAKQSGVGSLKAAMQIYAEDNKTLSHAFEDPEALFPEYELTKKGEPELLERDYGWVEEVIRKIHKSPISRVRTRQADARIAELRAKGYQTKGDEKTVTGKIKMLSRTTDPQTVYIKDSMHRDDIIDVVDFDTVAYNWKVMKHTLNEELAIAALIGDGRDDGDPDKIHETHVRSIWNDDELYTIHKDVDIKAAKTELQGTNTSVNFGENYIYAEAIITAALYAREKYKGSGTPDLYCTPHLLNVMLLARDLNGRRIYDSKSDLAAALNVGDIYTIEQFEGRTRTTSDGKTKKLLGLFVNLADYQFGATKGGEITKFEDFDMDFNRYKYMLETRISGALTKVYSAIALEEPVNESEAAG